MSKLTWFRWGAWRRDIAKCSPALVLAPWAFQLFDRDVLVLRIFIAIFTGFLMQGVLTFAYFLAVYFSARLSGEHLDLDATPVKPDDHRIIGAILCLALLFLLAQHWKGVQERDIASCVELRQREQTYRYSPVSLVRDCIAEKNDASSTSSDDDR